MAQDVEGFQIVVHQSLIQPMLLGGAPRSLAIINGTLAAALGLGLKMWLAGLGLWLIGHTLSVLAAKSDPHFVEVVLRHVRQKAWLSC